VNFKIKTLALAIGASTLAIAMPSHALLITSTVESSVQFTAGVNGNTQGVTDGPTNSTDISFYGQTENPNLNINPFSGGGYVKGDSAGNSELKSLGPWYTQTAWLSSPFIMQTESNIVHKAVITNDTANMQNLNFNFLITAGTITSNSEQIQGNNYVSAGYSATIAVDGINLWNSAGLAKHDENGKSVTLSGTSLGGTAYSDSDWYSWDNYSDSLGLGFLSPGESLTIEYSLTTYVNEYFEDDGYSYTPYATIGDPFDFNSSPLFGADKFVEAGTSTNVPEPVGAALLGLGLAGLAFRRKSKTAKA